MTVYLTQRIDAVSYTHLLAHRLASYCSHLAHPQFPLIGTGPFRLTQFTAELVRLESHDYYHLRHPLLKAVEYWITPVSYTHLDVYKRQTVR